MSRKPTKKQIMYGIEIKTSMPSEDLNDELTQAIQEKYGEMDIYETEAIAEDYDTSTLEMFEITSIHHTYVELTSVFHDEIISPVVFDWDIHPLLQEGDVMLMSLGLKNQKWHVIYMSPPYEEGVL